MNKQQPKALQLAHVFDHPIPPEWSDMVAAAAELRRQHARITELESQLAQRFDAADRATASAQGFRDGVASLTAQAADSVQEDAARYRWLREGNDAKHGAAWHVAVNLYGCEWDAAIDAARKRGEKQ